MIKHKRALGGALTLAAAVGVMGGSLPANAATAATTANATTAQSPHTADDAHLRALMHRLTTVDGAPGALVATRDRRGGAVLTSGVADVDSQAPVRGDSRFRIGSMTKPSWPRSCSSWWESNASISTPRWSATCPASSAATETTAG